jgi:folate-dependent phosphoribosylglycinamide formyltransferase PurN
MSKTNKLNVVLITGTYPHHKYWAYNLFGQFHVVGIFHPYSSSSKIKLILQKIRNNSRYGFVWFVLRLVSILYQRLSKFSANNMGKKAEKAFFEEYEKKYLEIPEKIIHHIRSVNDEEVIDTIKKLNADIICVLGGEIVSKELINSAKIASLNFHSGLAPFYNGANTIYWAVSDFRPNFAGGTLMYISERIDGGPIIMHYLPSIEMKDTASSLFMKNIQGAVRLYTCTIKKFERGETPTGIVQQRSFRYLKGIDWTIFQDLRLKSFHHKGEIKKYIREERIIDYSDNKVKLSYTFEDILSIVLKKENIIIS